MKGKGFTLLEVLIAKQRSWRVSKTRGFTLLEVLIAGSILFVVSAAIIGLNNSIISGTAANASNTITNRFASEGLELATTVRNNNVLQAYNQGGNQIWFTPATAIGQYGWYVLSQSGTDWLLNPAAGASNTLPFSTFMSAGQALTSQTLTAARLICVEAIGAVTVKTDTTISCNTSSSGSAIVSDGDRSQVAVCDPVDVYCADTEPSLNRDLLTGATQSIIPAGNAVKVRSVVVTPNKMGYFVSDLATILTNWKGFEQPSFNNGNGLGSVGSVGGPSLGGP